MLTIDAVTQLDRSSNRRADAVWLAEQRRREASRFIVLIDLKPVIAPPAALLTLTPARVSELGLGGETPIFLGVDDRGSAWFALLLDGARAQSQSPTLPEQAVELRQLATEGVLAREALSLAGQARALGEWHRVNRCCSACGGMTAAKDGGWRRQCWSCGRETFPRTDPVVIMLPVCGDRCLMARGPHFPPETFSALAGFLEPGEDIERAVQREVLEEVGLTVGTVTYQESQPWPFPHSLMIGCRAEVADERLTIDPAEIAEAYWTTRAEGQLMLDGTHPLGRRAPGHHAIARELLVAFVEERPLRSFAR